MPQVKIIAKNFMDMVASLPAMKLDMLYDNTFICEAVLRSLPPLAKKYVLQLLFIDEPVTGKSMEEWLLADGFSKHRVSIDRLIQLRVFIESIDRKKETSYKLNPKFQGNLQKYLIHGGVLPREAMHSSVTVRLPTLEELEAYALGQWECFLLQLISSTQAENTTSFSSSMMKVFQRGLLSQREREAPRLTVNGFQFLLMETNAQLWYIIREYISNAEDRGVDSADLISFLLELSFHVTGEAYNTNTLTEVQRSTIKDLADLGLIKLQQGRKESWFIPTKLATDLSVSLSDSASRKEGFVVVETNFRLYAYSTSKLHCEILRLFSRFACIQHIVLFFYLKSGWSWFWVIPIRRASSCFVRVLKFEGSKKMRGRFEACKLFPRVEYQLPNLIVGAITKESLYNAFENGITSDQIISFLQQNAHPRVAERTPSVPENVTDQIRLWETDLNRVEMTLSHFYDDFPSREAFEAACDFARENGGFLWEDSTHMRLIVKADIHVHMREYIRRQK